MGKGQGRKGSIEFAEAYLIRQSQPQPCRIIRKYPGPYPLTGQMVMQACGIIMTDQGIKPGAARKRQLMAIKHADQLIMPGPDPCALIILKSGIPQRRRPDPERGRGHGPWE